MQEAIRRAITLPENNGRYEIQFTFDGKKYSTYFLFTNKSFTNGCITIKVDNTSDPWILDTNISSNSPTKNCFRPTLLKDNLPPGVTQTDILQVLTTKLRFMILYPKEEVTLVDSARLINPSVIGDTYTTRISLWRLFRKEPTIYEKYGYASDDYNNFRRAISDITWVEIKDYTVNKRDLLWRNNIEQSISLNGILQEFYPGILVDDTPINDSTLITDIVKEIRYEDTERSVTRIAPDNDYVTIIDIMADAIREKFMFEDGTPVGVGSESILKLSKESELWKSWDSRLVIVSFKQLGMPGGYRRSYRRRMNRRKRHYRQTRKIRIKLNP